MSDYNRILLIQTAFLGDAILTTPLIKAIKQKFPKAELDLLTIPQSCVIFKNNPYIKRIHVFNKRKLIFRILSFVKMLNIIRQANYDVAISAHISFSSSLMMYLPKIPVRIGFPRQKLLTHPVLIPKGVHVAKRYLMLMKALTDQEFSSQTELYWTVETDNMVNSILSGYNPNHNIVIGIAPGSIWKTKRWLPEYFSNLINLLDEERIKTVLIGGNDDLELCKFIEINSRVQTLNLAGKLDIQGSAALIKRLRLIVTNDSAPLHIANAVETDVIAIFGPTVKSFGFYPFREHDQVLEVDLACRPCGKHGGNKCSQKHFRCMKGITPDLVLKAIHHTLEHN